MTAQTAMLQPAADAANRLRGHCAVASRAANILRDSRMLSVPMVLQPPKDVLECPRACASRPLVVVMQNGVLQACASWAALLAMLGDTRQAYAPRVLLTRDQRR